MKQALLRTICFLHLAFAPGTGMASHELLSESQTARQESRQTFSQQDPSCGQSDESKRLDHSKIGAKNDLGQNPWFEKSLTYLQRFADLIEDLIFFL